MPPQVNNSPQGNQNQFFGQKVSIPGIDVNSAGDNQLILKDNYTTRIYYSSLGIPSVLLGTRVANANNGLAKSELGLYVGQNGIDVTQATNAQLIFNSEQNVLKVGISGTYTFAAQGNIAPTGVINVPVVTIPHGLGIIPALACFLIIPSVGQADNPFPAAVSAPWNNLWPYAFGLNAANGVPYNNYILDSNYVQYIQYAGADDTNLYLSETIYGQGTTHPTVSQTFTYYVYANSL